MIKENQTEKDSVKQSKTESSKLKQIQIETNRVQNSQIESKRVKKLIPTESFRAIQGHTEAYKDLHSHT